MKRCVRDHLAQKMMSKNCFSKPTAEGSSSTTDGSISLRQQIGTVMQCSKSKAILLTTWTLFTGSCTLVCSHSQGVSFNPRCAIRKFLGNGLSNRCKSTLVSNACLCNLKIKQNHKVMQCYRIAGGGSAELVICTLHSEAQPELLGI